MNIKELQKRIYAINEANGWYEKPCSFGERIALLHSEASEMLEADRKEQRSNLGMFHVSDLLGEEFDGNFKNYIKDTVDDEAADVFIRLLDLCELYNIDLEAQVELKLQYNAQRGYKHGGKKY